MQSGTISLDSAGLRGVIQSSDRAPGRHDRMLPELSVMRRDDEPWLTPTSVHALRSVRKVDVHQLMTRSIRGTLSHHARRSRH